MRDACYRRYMEMVKQGWLRMHGWGHWLTMLYGADCGIKDQGGVAIGKALETNATLNSLHFRGELGRMARAEAWQGWEQGTWLTGDAADAACCSTGRGAAQAMQVDA